MVEQDWINLWRVANSLVCIVAALLMFTLPGGPSNRNYKLLTIALGMFCLSAAYGSIVLLGDPSLIRPLFVTGCALTTLWGISGLYSYRRKAIREGRTDWGAR